MLGVLPVAAQTTGIQRTWLLSEETSQLGDLLFGPGVAEVTTASTGATTAGGTISWVRYFEKDDHLGMHHVYYRQQYEHPQLGRALRVLGTAVSLHYAPDGSLSRANLAQVDDVPSLPDVALTTPQQAFAAAHMGLASWPGFRLGDPARWPPGTLASILDRSELMLEAPRDAGSWRLIWSLPVPDADWESYTALVDAATGELVRVSQSNPHDNCPPVGCSHCSPGHDGMDPPVHTTAVAVAENPAITALREVAANPFSDPEEQEENCGGSTCTHEAVSAQREGVDPENDPPIPQIEVYHGIKMMAACRHCGYSGYGFDEGKYMRVGLMEIGGSVRYDDYNPGHPGKALERCDAHDLYRLFAGDAMFYTQQTMEVFSSTFKRCGFDGSCGVARVVVDAEGYTGTAQFNVDILSHLAPYKSVQLDNPRADWSRFSVSASLDTVAHEWGHAVDFQSPGNFVARCAAEPHPLEVCEMTEGFAEVIGHVVERLKQTTPDTNLEDNVYEAEHWDWTAQEDFSLVSAWPHLRRADRYSTIQCPGNHHSVHAEDAGCGWGYSANGNRLAVVLKLLTDGGNNPGAGHVVPCTGCDIEVTPLDPDADTSFEMAAKILFRVFDTEADPGTVDWDELPVLARNAIHDLYWGETCVAAQLRTNNAFLAVGYPESGLPPCIHCRPYQAGQPPCCPPDYPCLGEEE